VQRVSADRTARLSDDVVVLSNAVDLVKPISWVEPSAAGLDPSNCYLVIAPDESLLIDTGLRAHSSSLAGQIARYVSASTPLSIALTRIEPDCLGGLLEVAERFNLVRISSQSNVIPFDYLGPFSSRFPQVQIVNGLHPGDEIPVGRHRRLLVVEPAVRTLPTLWYLDRASGTLFTSDFFGEDRPSDPDDWQGHAVDVGTARRHLHAKFDWLAIADTSAALSRLDRAFSSFEIKTIAPGHGLWLTGTAQVEERYRVVRTALEPV